MSGLTLYSLYCGLFIRTFQGTVSRSRSHEFWEIHARVRLWVTPRHFEHCSCSEIVITFPTYGSTFT